MNARERFIATIRFQQIDRPFRWECVWFWPSTLERWKEEGLPEYVNEDTVFDYFGMDPIKFIPVTGGWTGTPFCPAFETILLEDDGVNVIQLESDGIIKKQRKVDSHKSMPQFLRFPVQDGKDFEELSWRLDPSSRDRLPQNWESLVAQYKQRDYPLGIYVCGSFGHPRNLLGDENLMFALYDDPELIHAIGRQWLELYKGYISLVCRDVIPDFIMIWEDMAYNNGPLISPAQFRTFMLPYLTELIAYAKSKGIPCIILDSDGDIHELLPLFLEAGVDGVFPFEVKAGMDVREVRKQYGNRLAIIGGLDKAKLAVGKVETLEELDEKVPCMLETKGYLPMLDHSCPPNVSLEVFQYYVDKMRTYG